MAKMFGDPPAASDDQRASDRCWEAGDVLAVIYTIGYLLMVGGMFVFPVPEANSQTLNTLVTIMSTIQIGISKCYYDGVKADKAAQRMNAIQQARTSSTIQKIAETVPTAAAAAVVAAAGGPAASVAIPPAVAGAIPPGTA